LKLRYRRAGDLIGQASEEARCAVVALDSIECMKGFLHSINFVQLRVQLQPPIEQKAAAMVELEAVAEQQTTHWKGAAIAGDFLPAAVDG